MANAICVMSLHRVAGSSVFMWPMIFVLLVLLNFSGNCEAFVSSTSSIRDDIVKTLFANYQKHVRPSELTQNETVVTVYISISAITSVDVRNMEYTTDMLLRQEWQDPRLAWDRIPRFSNYTKNIVSPVFKEKIWLPDLFFRNGKEGRLHKMTCENLLIRIQPNGEILYSQKITMRLACQMQLHTFPMDTQECGMNIGSYGYTLKEVRFVWRNHSPVSLPANLQISEFDPPDTVSPHDCSSLYSTSTGQYTCLNVTFILSRQLAYWLASTYIPNILIMVVSWLNFWVSVEATPARVNLSLLTLLGVITQSTSYASILPRVSYIKAIDVWTIACIAFNSGVLMEFAVASHLSRRQKVSVWHSDVRKMVRRELARWCTACQQQYKEWGPSASMAYMPASKTDDKTAQYIETAVTAANVIENDPLTEPASVSMRTKGGLMGMITDRGSPYKSPSSARRRHRGDVGDSHGADVNLVGMEAAQTEALIPPAEPKGPPKSPEINKIDRYSRILFPTCFLFYNFFYWFYYLFLMKRQRH